MAPRLGMAVQVEQRAFELYCEERRKFMRLTKRRRDSAASVERHLLPGSG